MTLISFTHLTHCVLMVCFHLCTNGNGNGKCEFIQRIVITKSLMRWTR